MSVQPSKQALNFKLPEMLSYHSTWDDADYEPVLAPTRPGPARRVAAMLRRLAALPARMAVRNELCAMSDRELADIGINRYDVNRVFDSDFADEHARRGRV